MQGASVKQTRSVCSERARTPAGGRSRCVFAKQIRGFSAQRPGPISMRCRLSSGCPCPAPTQAPNRGESNSMQGASVKQTRSVCSERARTPAGGRSRCVFAKQIRGFSAKTSTQNGCDVYRISAGHAPHQRIPSRTAENRTQCRARALRKRLGNADRDALSQWQPRRKAHPGIPPQTGT